MIPTYLQADCFANEDLCQGCADVAKQAPTGRWFITMGHCGFNSPANNRSGYATQAAAVAASKRYQGKKR